MSTALRRNGLATRFLILVTCWTLATLWLIRLSVVERLLFAPLTAFQARIALWYTGVTQLPVQVTLACSGADVLAVTIAVALAYPVGWSRRLAGAAIGSALILTLNTGRIALLAQAVHSPWFGVLHLHVLPALLVLALVAWLLLWLRLVEGATLLPASQPVRSAVTSAVALAAYVAAMPLLEASGLLALVARGFAQASASAFTAIGVQAAAHGTMLTTSHGSFVISAECIVTPLMPVYLALALTLPNTWRTRLLALAAFVPVFGGLVTMRLLTVALPPILGGQPLVLTHAFHQLTLGLATLVLTRWWLVGRLGGRDARLIAAAATCGGALIWLLADAAPAVTLAALRAASPFAGHAPTALLPSGDVQGAFYLLPSFSIALLLGLWIIVTPPRRWTSIALSVALTAAAVVAWLLGLAEVAAHTGLHAPVVWTRAWAVMTPLAAMLVVRHDDALPERVRGSDSADAAGDLAGR
jgi:exosortase/archaeosortase family protein